MNKQEVLKKIGKDNWSKFQEFMVGQTISIDWDGKDNYYKCDVDNFINHMKGRRTFFD
jgi:hypothetical protein